MSKITLNSVGSLIDSTTAQSTINTNFATIQTAVDNTLSRDGTSPDTMLAPLDMNNNQIINLPAPATTHSPLRLSDLNSFIGGGTISSLPPGGTTGQVLGKNSNTDYDTAWQTKVISVAQAAPGDFTVTGSPVTSSGTLTLGWATPPLGSGAMARTTNTTLTTPTINTPTISTPTITGHPTIEGVTSTGATGTGKLVYDTSPTIPSITGPLAITSASGTSLTVGPNGASNPTLTLDSSAPSGVTGLRVVNSATGGTVNILTTDSGSNNNLAFNAKGTGTIGFGTVSTGGVNIGNTTTVTSSGASSLAVGPNGSSNPTLSVDSSTGSQVAGLRIKGATTTNPVVLDVTDTSANGSLSLSGKGAGTVSIANTSTGGIFLNNAVTLSSTINKVTLTAPATAATLTLTNNTTVTGPATSDTLVGKATTDTLTNKTISASGTGNSINLNPITNSIGANVTLNNTANYFDGPSIAQGTTGTWFASGTVTVADTGAAANILAKLWDGTTVIASGSVTTSGAGPNMTIALSGFITNPAANLRISCRDTTAITGLILANASGNSKDSTITAFRIG